MPVSNNWQTLKAQLSGCGNSGLGIGEKGHKQLGDAKVESKRRRVELNEAVKEQKTDSIGQLSEVPKRTKLDKLKYGQNRVSDEVKARYVGLDCEMVGTGSDGKESLLARCCMVNFDGDVIYDSFVKPQAFVTDFRTQWSGVRPKDLFGKGAKNTVTLSECQHAVAGAIKNKILLGHALSNDLQVLGLSHPRHHIRDTARYRPFMRKSSNNKYRPRALRELAKDFLGTTIQTGEHDPSEDARSAVMLYRLKMHEWERELKERKFHTSKNVETVKGIAGQEGNFSQDEDRHGKEVENGGGDITENAVAVRSTNMFGEIKSGIRSVKDVDQSKSSKRKRDGGLITVQDEKD